MEDTKRKILDFFRGLEFDKDSHSYSVEENKISASVSKLISSFVEPFDTYNISLRVAKKRGISQKEVLSEWNKKRDLACTIGTDTHLFGEFYPFNKHLKPKNKLEEAVVKFWNDLPNHVVPLMMELQMYHKDYLFAGTTDIVLYNKETDKIILGDYKTNENLFKNYRGKKMLYPFDNLLDNPFNKYQLQLSFYQILFEQTGLEVSSRKLIWLRPTGNYELYNTEDYTELLKEYLKQSQYKKSW